MGILQHYVAILYQITTDKKFASWVKQDEEIKFHLQGLEHLLLGAVNGFKLEKSDEKNESFQKRVNMTLATAWMLGRAYKALEQESSNLFSTGVDNINLGNKGFSNEKGTPAQIEQQAGLKVFALQGFGETYYTSTSMQEAVKDPVARAGNKKNLMESYLSGALSFFVIGAWIFPVG